MRNHTISQELPDWFKVTNSLYMSNRASILKDEYFIGSHPVMERLSRLSGIDIDYIEDYRIARALYAVYEEDALHAVDPASHIDWPATPIHRPATTIRRKVRNDALSIAL